jgi:hypothetical protein
MSCSAADTINSSCGPTIPTSFVGQRHDQALFTLTA